MSDILITGKTDQILNIYQDEVLYIVKKDDCKLNIINLNPTMSKKPNIILHFDGNGDVYIDDGIDVIISNKSGSGNLFFRGKVPRMYGQFSGSGRIIPDHAHVENKK